MKNLSGEYGLVFHWISILLELTKFKISLLATLFTSAGFILAHHGLSEKMISPVLAVLFLASGACALNQYQERKIDRAMERTRGRPIPSQRLRPSTALWMSQAFIFSGLMILCHGTNGFASGLGVFALLWYNGVYTYLKRWTPFAAIPGALVGAIPPAIGWTSAGGTIFHPQLFVLAFFSFLWQVPHFWLILLGSGMDYERAGLPSLSRVFTPSQLRRITFIWICSTAVLALSLPLFYFNQALLENFFLLTASLWLAWNAVRFLKSPPEMISFRLVFMKLNLFVLWVITSLSLGQLLGVHLL
jgi:protoheme IX farnesyltransferase